MSDTRANISGATATVTFGSKAKTKNLEVRVDSGTVQQFIGITVDGGTPDNRGAVGKIVLEDQALSDDSKKVVIKLQYQNANKQITDSKLQVGGPYIIGKYWMMVIVADNGTDNNFNDVVVRLSGATT